MTAAIAPSRKSWLEVSRPRAFLTHLGSSAARSEAARRIAALTAELGANEDELGFLPLVAKNRDLSFIVDATGAPLGVLDVDPWIGSATGR